MDTSGMLLNGEVAVALAPGVGVGLAFEGPAGEVVEQAIATPDPVAVVAAIEASRAPRWVWWSNATAEPLVAADVHLARCWDLAAVHRLLVGGFRADPARIVAALAGLDAEGIPSLGQMNLLDERGDDGGDPELPLRADGHVRPEWAAGGWAATPTHLARWAALALRMRGEQVRRLAAVGPDGRAASTARSESAAELLCAELERDGLPIDVAELQRLVEAAVGPRTSSSAAADAARVARDRAVLQHVPGSDDIDLRNPANVRSLMRRVGIEVTNTRAWRLERYREAHPVVPALLAWRKAERIATTYGYAWMDAHVGPDGRLRGAWTGCDGAAGRMTAQAGLHNLPAELRGAVRAEPGHAFVRADLGQIEPRVLAAVSGDRHLAAATLDDDLYAPVAARLGVDRPAAKIAVLAAMYGQTSGTAGQALRGMEEAYPIAMEYLRRADDSGRAGRDLRTDGGRLLRMWRTPSGLDDAAERANANSRGRYARNAVVQGAAAELFKAWAVTVRARARPLGARIVLCLHDELLVHAPLAAAADAARLVDECLQEAASRWARGAPVRFVADTTIVERWSEAH